MRITANLAAINESFKYCATGHVSDNETFHFSPSQQYYTSKQLIWKTLWVARLCIILIGKALLPQLF